MNIAIVFGLHVSNYVFVNPFQHMLSMFYYQRFSLIPKTLPVKYDNNIMISNKLMKISMSFMDYKLIRENQLINSSIRYIISIRLILILKYLVNNIYTHCEIHIVKILQRIYIARERSNVVEHKQYCQMKRYVCESLTVKHCH